MQAHADCSLNLARIWQPSPEHRTHKNYLPCVISFFLLSNARHYRFELKSTQSQYNDNAYSINNSRNNSNTSNNNNAYTYIDRVFRMWHIICVSIFSFGSSCSLYFVLIFLLLLLFSFFVVVIFACLDAVPIISRHACIYVVVQISISLTFPAQIRSDLFGLQPRVAALFVFICFDRWWNICRIRSTGNINSFQLTSDQFRSVSIRREQTEAILSIAFCIFLTGQLVNSFAWTVGELNQIGVLKKRNVSPCV